MQEVFMTGKDLPELAAVVVARGKMEESADAQDFPIAKAAFSFLPETEAISFTHKLPTYRALVDDAEFRRYVELYAKASLPKTLILSFCFAPNPLKKIIRSYLHKKSYCCSSFELSLWQDEDAFFRVGVGVVVTAAVVILSYGDFCQRSKRASYCSSMAFK